MSRYDKEKVIGSGTFGNVWLVKSRLSRHSYVLKEIDLRSLNETDRQHALNEVSILSKCKHKHIIRYKDAVIETDLKLSIVMEYAEGGDLHTAILKQRGVPFSEHRIISWFIQICLALQYIHYQNTLHRDLKSQNIFLTRNKMIKVGDFGIARVLKNPEELAKTAIGTPYYLSPEICQRKPYNHKSDIWALGCILFEMAALEHAFQAVDFIHLVSLILKGNRKELPRHCSSIIQDLVKDLLEFDPEKRPSTEVILAYPSLQPYLSEYMLTHGSRQSFLPVLISPKETKTRGSSVSDIFENLRQGSRKRRSSSTSEMNQKAASTSTGATVQENQRTGWKFLRNTSKKMPINSSKTKLDRNQESTHKAPNPKLTLRFNKKEQSALTVSCDTYTVAASGASHSKSKLTKSEDPLLNDTDYGYQSCNSHLSPSGSSNKENKGTPKSQHKMQQEKIGRAFHATENGKDSATEHSRDDANLHNNCQHSQCHQCMLDMLWKNRIRCYVEGSVNTDEYSRLRNKLFFLYKEDLFDKIYQSLLWDWGGNKNAPSPNILKMMQSLNYEQVQSLPLMMQLVQLDLFLKSKQKCQNASGIEP
ncbi:Serine/threonine-protein kinase Nek1 [Araneus ventricosus]|uniref:non-specific serine/threonine protein kinase n=1 Tax=Araneus ventricosus TaxID=182803 RepID=A0A4Y2CUC3_ARAVE|nr:Serine/threonine-protein kinase Nek1 [Araneus ventricosus]